MTFNFGGPIMAQSVPTEAVAGRENRDVAQVGGDDHYAPVVGGNVRDGSAGTLSVIAATAAGGRTDRNYLEQGGDHDLEFNPADPQNPTDTVNAHGRTDRLYVDAATGVSVLSGTADPEFAELAKGDAPTDLATDPLD